MSSVPVADRSLVDPLEDLLGYQLRRASAVLMADLAQALASVDLRPAEASVLLFVESNCHATQSEIGRRLGIKRANMTPLAAALESRQLLYRSPVDGRSQGLRLTRKGNALAARVRELVADQESRYFGRMDPRRRQLLMASLRDIRETGRVAEEADGS